MFGCGSDVFSDLVQTVWKKLRESGFQQHGQMKYFMWVPINSGNHSGSCSENCGLFRSESVFPEIGVVPRLLILFIIGRQNRAVS